MRSAVLTAVLLALTALGCSRDEPPAGPATAAHGARSEHAARSPGGYVAVRIEPERVQRFGIRAEPVRREALVREVRTVGVVRTDETRESHVHVKWEGWIQEFFVSFVGQQVQRGDPLFSVYSPELVTAQQELLIALARANAARGASRPGERESAEALLDTARTKLRLYDVPPDAIEQVEKDGRVLRALTVRAPRSGTVIEKAALPGMYVEPEMDLYTIADLSRVWVLADLYEYEAPFVHAGQHARFAAVGAEAAPADVEATVAFVAPTVGSETRTVKIRLELGNEDGKLRPGAYGTVRLEIPLEPALVVPADAVLDTGVRQLVFVRAGEGLFEPRAVRLGARAGGRVQVLDGLAEGDSVVTRAQFLLDSESRLRATAEAAQEPHGTHP